MTQSVTYAAHPAASVPDNPLRTEPAGTEQDISQTNESNRLGRVSLAVGDLRAIDVEASVKARMLRELAMWYRAFAERTGNPAVWEARLRAAEDLDAEASRVGQRRRQLMIIKTCAFSMLCALFIGAAAAQTPSGPTVDGRHLQPTQQQVDGRQDARTREWDRGVQSQVDYLYGELLRASSPEGRQPPAKQFKAGEIR